MNKLSSVALSAALVVAGVGASVSAEARSYVSVACPGGAVVERIGYARPFYARDSLARGRYWRHEFERDRYEHFHRDHWDRR
jgi:hypothetical protein